MPKRKGSDAEPNEYTSDNGFVADAPKSKKPKSSKEKKGLQAPQAVKKENKKEKVRDVEVKSKKEKKLEKREGKDRGAVDGGLGKKVDKSGEVFWELSEKRRISISKFAGKEMVNIREFYEKDGELFPGKKGITLPMEQYNALVTIMPQLEIELQRLGHAIQRPDYSGKSGVQEDTLEDEGEDEEEEEDEGDEEDDEEEAVAEDGGSDEDD